MKIHNFCWEVGASEEAIGGGCEVGFVEEITGRQNDFSSIV